ncbi:PLP-dependent aminotransferase family protein [Phenylobacterium sp. VNQ135]|uniref:aminotransferase-like domain-containing protein n=1 Tax=Phenylobacterium sp. VNQ135 TaxID=3400922 RepID=UPI003C09D0DF
MPMTSAAADRSATSWLARVRPGGPVYLAILAALTEAIRTGELQPGDRLPPQRTVAERLGVDLTTVTRAYAAARDRGLVEGTVGRGTFVRARREEDEGGVVDLSMNLPPPPAGLSLGRLLQETSAAILQRTDAATLMAYHPGAGALGQRIAGAQWLAPHLGEVSPERVLVAPGAQAALAAVLSCLCRPGDAVVAETLTYPGFRSIAAPLGLRVLACPVDAEGPLPEALERLCRTERPRALYVVPTMQNPVATTMGEARRRDIARIAEAADAWILEDDPYSRLCEAPPQALAAFAPDRTFHIGTLAKCLTPGLRIAYVAAPPAQAERAADALRATALMTAPLMAAVAATWIREGAAQTLLNAVRAEAIARRALAAEALPAAIGAAESLHVWLPLTPRASPDALRRTAQERGLSLITSEAFATSPEAPNGVRISLGGVSKRTALADALRRLGEIV